MFQILAASFMLYMLDMLYYAFAQFVIAWGNEFGIYINLYCVNKGTYSCRGRIV